MSQTADETAVLSCPECSRATREGALARIGNRKSACALCNRFAQAVRRRVARALAEAHPEEAEALRREAEREAYAALVGSTDQEEQPR